MTMIVGAQSDPATVTKRPQRAQTEQTEQTELESLRSDSSAQSQQAAAIQERLERILVKLRGQRPEPVSPSKTDSPGSIQPLLTGLRESMKDIRVSHNKAAELIGELESLI